LIGIAALFDVDIVQMLTDPQAAAAQLLFDFEMPKIQRRSRVLIPGQKQNMTQFKKELKEVVEGKGPYPSLKQFCLARRYHPAFAHEHCRSLATKLHNQRSEYKQKQMSQLKVVAMPYMREQLKKYPHETLRNIARDAATKHNAPVHLMRLWLKELRAGQGL
jgi:hypothetical protein